MKTFYLLFFVIPFWVVSGSGQHYFQHLFGISNSLQNYAMQEPSDTMTRKENPVIPGDIADPSVIRKGDVYYATGTSSEWAPHYPLFQSADLLHWQPMGYVFLQTPSWALASFWAPELFYHNGTYLLYYVARRKSDGISCIGVATSLDPAKGFTDKGVLLPFGKEAIDPFVIEDEGQLYITWKAYGLDDRPIEILGSRLSDDGLKVTGEPFSLLRDDDRKGLEGQCLVKRNGYYYLIYSPGACCGRNCSYVVEVARSASLRGPYTRYNGNPLLSETQEWKCTGHGTVVTTKEGADYYLYHAYSKATDVYTGRQGMLGKIYWNAQTGWPSIEPVGAKAEPIQNFRDDFTTTSLSDAWQWDFRHSQPSPILKNGHLYLSGTTMDNNTTGLALTVRPLSGDYEMVTKVLNQNASLKGLVLYGDASQSVGIGMAGNAVQVWVTKDNQRTMIGEKHIAAGKSVYLKMGITNGYLCRFYWSENGTTWNEINTGGNAFNGDFLPPWDRSPRPGLWHSGTTKNAAGFDFFCITYQ